MVLAPLAVAQLTSSLAIKPSLNPASACGGARVAPNIRQGLQAMCGYQLHPGHNSICDVEPGQYRPLPPRIRRLSIDTRYYPCLFSTVIC